MSESGPRSMAAFFTADTHFGDPGILRQRGRMFRSLVEHDEELIARWNAAVTPADDVWHIGDFAAGASRERCAEIFARLHGTKRLIRGNHDTNRVLTLPWRTFRSRASGSPCATMSELSGVFILPTMRIGHGRGSGAERDTSTATPTRHCRTPPGPATPAWMRGVTDRSGSRPS